MEATGSKLLYVDCNAIAPSTARARADHIWARRAVRGRRHSRRPTHGETQYAVRRLGTGRVRVCRARGVAGSNIRVIDGDVGSSFGLKMCFAAMSKGLQALGIELLVTAAVSGIEKELREEQLNSQKGPLSLLQRSVPAMPTKAHRWVSEMEEIAQTFADTGFTPEIYTGVANLYRWVATTPLAAETPENRERSRDLDGVIEGSGGGAAPSRSID